MPVAKDLHGGLPHPNPVLVEEVVGQFGVGPIGSIQATGGGPVDDPLAQGGCKIIGKFGRGPGTFADVKPFESALEVGVEPTLDGAGVMPKSRAMSWCGRLRWASRMIWIRSWSFRLAGAAKRLLRERTARVEKVGYGSQVPVPSNGERIYTVRDRTPTNGF